MNTNLNNIPLEIFLDYCTEQTNLEWTTEHIITIILAHCYITHTILESIISTNGNGQNYQKTGCGFSYGYGGNIKTYGNGYVTGIGDEYGINDVYGSGINPNVH